MAASGDHGGDDQDVRLVRGEKIVISKLPRSENGWLTENLYQYQGCWYFPGESALEGVFRAQEHFKANSSDILLCSIPKSGTTWIKALVFAIMNRDNNNNCGPNLLASSPHECIPNLESPQDSDNYRVYYDDDHDNNNNNGQPRLLATHMPITALPTSVFTAGSKVVYICRDPKDVLVSLWHFVGKIKTRRQEQPISLEEAYKLFCEGISPYGPYWNHVLGYWKASLEQPQRVLFLKYEDMKREPLVYVNKLAPFLDRPFESEVQAKEIVDLCSFETLSNLEVNKDGVYRASGILKRNNVFFRQGKAGDWMNHLTPEMADRLNQITRHKLDGSGLVLV